MRPYATEIYLPCKIPSLRYTSRRTPIPATMRSIPIGLAPASAIPFHTGGLLLFRDSAFFVEDFELLLALNSCTSTVQSLVESKPKWQTEVEELNAVGALQFGPSTPALHYSVAAYKARRFYDDEDWINFALSPIVLELDITNNCNAQCIHCSRDAGPIRERDIQLPQIERLLAQCKIYNVPELLVMGGEPLLHPELAFIFRRARENGIRAIRISTNGICLTADRAALLAEYASHVQVSIHGASAKTHEAVTNRPGSFQKACEAVKVLRAAGVDVAVSCTVMDINEDELEALAELTLGLKANTLRYLALSAVGRGRALQAADSQWRDRVGARVKCISEDYEPQGLEVAVGGFPALKPVQDDVVMYGCAAARTHFHIAYDSSSNPCGSVDGYNICDMRTSDLLEAWHHPKMRGVRRASKCGCAYRRVCSGSCKADTDFAKNN